MKATKVKYSLSGIEKSAHLKMRLVLPVLTQPSAVLALRELELELIQAHITQKPILWVEVG